MPFFLAEKTLSFVFIVIMFYVFLDFLHTQKQKHKSKIKWENNQNSAYKEMQDAQMYENEAFNAWRVQLLTPYFATRI